MFYISTLPHNNLNESQIEVPCVAASCTTWEMEVQYVATGCITWETVLFSFRITKMISARQILSLHASETVMKTPSPTVSVKSADVNLRRLADYRSQFELI